MISSTDFPFHIMDVASLLRLTIRRKGPGYAYCDCPICGDQRGKTKLYLHKDVWHCYYCGEGGGMLSLYGRVHGVDNKIAYQEIFDALVLDGRPPEITAQTSHGKAERRGAEITQSDRAPAQELHRTYSAMLAMLSLTNAHREHLRVKRGLSDEDIEAFGFKSTPNPFICRSIANRLMKQGCMLEGVPGFYVDDKGYWTVRFFSKTSGIIIPVRSIDGLICGIQTRLDHPIKDKDDPPDKQGTKYLSLSSSGKNKGSSCGSLVQFVGNPNARGVYVTEGALKADIAHALTGRSFLATAGVNSLGPLDEIFAFLKSNGTEEIIEAEDMDKYRNKAVNKGAQAIFALAHKHGLACRRLTWNPSYKGIDDWQLALRRQEQRITEEEQMAYKLQYLYGCCEVGDIQKYINEWREKGNTSVSPEEYLGLTSQEYNVFLHSGPAGAFEELLRNQRRMQRFRIYQIDLNTVDTVPYAFVGIDKLRALGYEQPRASDYRLTYDSVMTCPKTQTDAELLERITTRFSQNPPKDYRGRSLSVSDVVELYYETQRTYFYRSMEDFSPIGFSPMLAQPMDAE